MASSIEVSLGLITASLPLLRPLIQLKLRAAWSSIRGSRTTKTRLKDPDETGLTEGTEQSVIRMENMESRENMRIVHPLRPNEI